VRFDVPNRALTIGEEPVASSGISIKTIIFSLIFNVTTLVLANIVYKRWFAKRGDKG